MSAAFDGFKEATGFVRPGHQGGARAIFRGASVDQVRRRHYLAAMRVLEAARRLYDAKAGFRPDQPRWPRGSGEEGGRWSGGEGLTSLVGGRTQGHHVVPREVAAGSEFNLSSDARKIFERETTGPAYSSRHYFDLPHREYNRAVRQALRDFLSERNQLGSSMSAADADEFIGRLYNSNDPVIKDFNLRIYRLRIYQIIRRFGPLGRE